jgi:hypothetical protein
VLRRSPDKPRCARRPDDTASYRHPGIAASVRVQAYGVGVLLLVEAEARLSSSLSTAADEVEA